MTDERFCVWRMSYWSPSLVPLGMRKQEYPSNNSTRCKITVEVGKITGNEGWRRFEVKWPALKDTWKKRRLFRKKTRRVLHFKQKQLTKQGKENKPNASVAVTSGELKNIVRVALLRTFFLITFVSFRYKLCFCDTVIIDSHANNPCCCWWWRNNTLPRCKERRDMCWEMLSYSKQQVEWCIWSSIKDKKNISGSDCRDVTTVPAKTLAANETERDPVVVYIVSLRKDLSIRIKNIVSFSWWYTTVWRQKSLVTDKLVHEQCYWCKQTQRFNEHKSVLKISSLENIAAEKPYDPLRFKQNMMCHPHKLHNYLPI